jgi:hypothetical protein
MGLILGGVMIFSVAFLSLYSVLRTYLNMAAAPAAPRVEMALAGGTAGLAPPAPVIARANAAAVAETPPPPQPEAPKGPWAVAAPPTWLATVDPAAAFVAAPFAAPSSNFDPQPEPADVAADVPLPRPRPAP